jgi:hypothetical protein
MSVTNHKLEDLKAKAINTEKVPKAENGTTLITSIEVLQNPLKPAGRGNEIVAYSLGLEFYKGNWFATSFEVSI